MSHFSGLIFDVSLSVIRTPGDARDSRTTDSSVPSRRSHNGPATSVRNFLLGGLFDQTRETADLLGWPADDTAQGLLGPGCGRCSKQLQAHAMSAGLAA
jgi:hypothetical protein